jgi:glutamine amidotransferase
MVVIIDYGMGNIGSVKNALEYLGASVSISSKKEDIKSASHLILPGVGAFGDGMKNLEDRGLIEILNEEVRGDKKPFLGVCLGMQLLADEGEEGGLNNGLGWIPGKVRRINTGGKLRIPHVGWNDVSVISENKMFNGISSNVFYFVHSYFLEPAEKDHVVATCEYGETMPVVINKENIWGAQFHPEKSQKSGLQFLKNFLNYA